MSQHSCVCVRCWAHPKMCGEWVGTNIGLALHVAQCNYEFSVVCAVGVSTLAAMLCSLQPINTHTHTHTHSLFNKGRTARAAGPDVSSSRKGTCGCLLKRCCAHIAVGRSWNYIGVPVCTTWGPSSGTWLCASSLCTSSATSVSGRESPRQERLVSSCGPV
jgi:hypothetical protein